VNSQPASAPAAARRIRRVRPLRRSLHRSPHAQRLGRWMYPPTGAPVAQAIAPTAQPAMQKMRVTVPAGVSGGQLLHLQTPSGLMQVTVPPGLTAGQQFDVMVPNAAPPTATATATAVAQQPQYAQPQQPQYAAPQPQYAPQQPQYAPQQQYPPQYAPPPPQQQVVYHHHQAPQPQVVVSAAPLAQHTDRDASPPTI